MLRASDSSVKSQMTHYRDSRKSSSSSGEHHEPHRDDGPDHLNFILLCLDYLRDVRRTNEADYLKDKKKIDADYLSLAIFALSRSIRRPDYLTNKKTPSNIFGTKSTSDHHKIPHISKITKEVLSPSSGLRPYDEGYDDLHPSNLYRFYPLGGLESGYPLGLDELVLGGLKDMDARCRLDAEREIVKSSHFDHYIQSVTARGYFYDKANSGKRKDPKEEEARKIRKVQVYKDRYRRAIAKYREKLALSMTNDDATVVNEVNADLLSAPGSPKLQKSNDRDYREKSFHSPLDNRTNAEGISSNNKDLAPMSPLTPNTVGPSNLAPSASSATPGKTRYSTPQGNYRPNINEKQHPTTKPVARESLINSPNRFPQKLSHNSSSKTKPEHEINAKPPGQHNKPLRIVANNLGTNDAVLKPLGSPSNAGQATKNDSGFSPNPKEPQKKVLSPKIQKVKNIYEQKLASSESSEPQETKYEGPTLTLPETSRCKGKPQKTVGDKQRVTPESLTIPDIAEPKPRASPNTTRKGKQNEKLQHSVDSGAANDLARNETRNSKSALSIATGLKPIRSPRKSSKTSCTSPVARLRHEQKEASERVAGEEGVPTPVTSPRRNKLSNDTSWINPQPSNNDQEEEKDVGKTFSFSSKTLGERLNAPKDLKLDPFQLAPPKCFSHLGAARILTAQGVEWGSTTNISSPRSLRASPRACSSPSNSVPAQRRGVC